MHDDRIAGVTFEKNASRNALIVNEEYAWVGNPFSAHDKRVIINELSLVFSFCGCEIKLSIMPFSRRFPKNVLPFV